MLGNIPAVFVATTSSIFDKMSGHFQLDQWEQTGCCWQDMWWQKTDIFDKIWGSMSSCGSGNETWCFWWDVTTLFNIVCGNKTRYFWRDTQTFSSFVSGNNTQYFGKTPGHFQFCFRQKTRYFWRDVRTFPATSVGTNWRLLTRHVANKNRYVWWDVLTFSAFFVTTNDVMCETFSCHVCGNESDYFWQDFRTFPALLVVTKLDVFDKKR